MNQGQPPAPNEPQGGFALVRSHDLAQLRELLIQFQQANALPPLHPETILVQSNGLAQWLRLGFAQAQGCATGLNFSFPSRFIWDAYRAVLGHNSVPSQSSLDRSSLVWRL
ncbi:MAG: exodeoxyribonuclease V subunit gamma, partial [Burkholderiaceae bacterium]